MGATAEQDFELPGASTDAPATNAEAKPEAVEEPTMSSQQKMERGGLVEEWDKHMEGFTPELLLSFPLAPRTDEYFYEDVTPPVLIRGGFFASSKEETSSVDFQVTDPAGDSIFEKLTRQRASFISLPERKALILSL